MNKICSNVCVLETFPTFGLIIRGRQNSFHFTRNTVTQFVPLTSNIRDKSNAVTTQFEVI